MVEQYLEDHRAVRFWQRKSLKRGRIIDVSNYFETGSAENGRDNREMKGGQGQARKIFSTALQGQLVKSHFTTPFFSTR